MAGNRLGKTRQPSLFPVLVLILAIAVQGTAGQLSWDKVPFISRFTKAAQAAKAAAASITAPHTASASPSSLPPAAPLSAPAAAGAPSTPAAVASSPVTDSSKAPAPAAGQQKKKNKGKRRKEIPLLKTTGKNDTQAGCSCLAEWEAKPGSKNLTGCANPDNDPLGAWCPIDPNQCMGYYSMYRTEKGKLRFYDYCGPVRERTKKGCLCSSDWSLGDVTVGKAHYRDGCARPLNAQGSRFCKVDSATCPPDVEVNEFDECADKQEPMLSSQETTWHKCGCVQGWNYRYEDGTTAIFSTCANPDADPLGPWCEVDPNTCDSATSIIKNGDQKMSIDYCQSRFQPAEAKGCTSHLKLYDQCGGKTNCTHSSCLNAPWPGVCCPRGSECSRQDSFLYQCLPLDADISTKVFKTAPPAAAEPDLSGTDDSSPAAAGSTGGSSDAKAENAVGDLDGASQPGNSAADIGRFVAGTRLWVRARLGMDYDLLVSQPQRMAQFKSDVIGWLKGVVGDTKHVSGSGVDEILPGSVIALSYLDFVRGTPLDVIEAAMERLHTVGQSQYAESKLPAKWGWLLNYSMGQNKTELMLEGTQGDAQMNTGAYPTASLKPAPKRNTQLSPGATVAIVVVCVAVLLSAGCGVFVARKKRIEKREAQKKAVAARQKAVVSGYLNDTGSMDDTASQATTTIKSTEQAASTLHKVGQGLRGALSTNRNTVMLNSGGSTHDSAPAKRPSETGSTRLWNWLQKAETPGSLDTRPEANLQTVLPVSERAPKLPSLSALGNGEAKQSLSSPRTSVLPSPRNLSSHPLPVLDLSDPGGAFRVPPPSPRYTERACGQHASPAEAAAAAVAAATASPARSNNNPLLSPRPAPAKAALGSQGDSPKRSSLRTGDERRAVGPVLSASSPTGRGDHHTYGRSHYLEPNHSAGTLYGTASDLSVLSPQTSGHVHNHSHQLPSHLSGLDAGEELAVSGRLPPGMGMGPFLRAAIKSLTGQSVDGSEDQSGGGAAPSPRGGYGAGASLYSSDRQTTTASLSSARGMETGSSTSRTHFSTSTGPGAIAAAARVTAEAAAAAEPSCASSSEAELQGSVFQSLWMHRLLAAAQAQQQDDDAVTYSQHMH